MRRFSSGKDGIDKAEPIRVLMITCQWPSPEAPDNAPFIVSQVEFLRRAGVEVDVFFFRGKKKVVNYLKAWMQLRRRLRRAHYDLVHAQFGQSALLPWPKRVPLVITFRGCEILGVKGDDGRTTLKGKLLQHLLKVVALGADAVIAVSEHMRPNIPSSVPLTIIPSGLDFDLLKCKPRDEARRELGLPLTDNLILFVGNPAEERKRYALATRAVEFLNRTLPATLIVGWDRPHSEIAILMSACDVLVFTSRQEGSPNVVKEALACNLPVVSVAVGDVPARLRGVVGCEVCPDERPETIANSLERVLRRGQRVEGRESVRNLDQNVLTEKLIRIYCSILGTVAPVKDLTGNTAVFSRHIDS